MNMKLDINKTIEELLEELDVPVDENFDDLFYEDDFYHDENEMFEDIESLLY